MIEFKGNINIMQVEKPMNNRNQALNLLKCFACIGVVFIHVVFPGLLGKIIKILSAFAVPCFYMIAGFYAFNCTENIIKRRLFKIMKIFLYSILLFFAFYFVVHIIEQDYNEWLIHLFTLKNTFKSIIFCTIDYAIPLWYLIAMIETYILWFFAVKYNKQEYLVKFIPLLFILRFILTSYVETKGLAWCLKINFITCSLNWFLLGYYIHKNKQKITTILNNKFLLLSILLGCTVALIPVIFNTCIKFSCIGLFFYSVALFIFAIKYEYNVITNAMTYIGEKLSLNIYILHVLIAKLLHYINVLQLHIQSVVLLFVKPLIVVVLTILIAYLIELIKNRLISVKGLKNT